MKFYKLTSRLLQTTLGECLKADLMVLMKFICGAIEGGENFMHFSIFAKQKLIDEMTKMLLNPDNVHAISNKLLKTELSKALYYRIVWEKQVLDVDDTDEEFGVELEGLKSDYHSHNKFLSGENGLVLRCKRSSNECRYPYDIDILRINENMIQVLRLLMPMPDDFYLVGVKKLEESRYSYSNESNVFNFINIISQMLENNLIEFGKTNEKPLTKSIAKLKKRASIQEFYDEKQLNSLATDMLTRSFSYYYFVAKEFKTSELESLKDFVKAKFEDRYYFFITRVLLSHLRKVKFDYRHSCEANLFKILEDILLNLPKDEWVTIKNILNYTIYRDQEFHLEDRYATSNYTLHIDNDDEDMYDYNDCEDNYYCFLYAPVIKGALFYLAALGIVDIKYDDPVSDCGIRAKDKEYISVWDSLKYVKITKLGRYLFGMSSSYELKEVKHTSNDLKFDEYKPIITVDENDIIMQAKLEDYTDKYEKNRYILSYAKIFKDCSSNKLLDMKIGRFYKEIELNPPKVFKEFFDEIKQNQNLLRKESKQVVIELKQNKKLLNLFKKNTKLQELVIKAQGYRVIVLKTDIPKLAKIVKDNGFFVDF